MSANVFDMREFDEFLLKYEEISNVSNRLLAKESESTSKKIAKSKFKRDKNLSNAIKAREIGSYWIINATDQPAKYEKYVHDGRDEIRAKDGKVLHWVANDGTDVFSKYASAFDGYQYYDKTFGLLEPKIPNFIKEAIDELGIEQL